jgi:ABC-2 type transport system permease protein
MVFLLPGAWGEWIGKLMPGNAGSPITTPVSFNPMLLDPWPGFAVFAGEVLTVLLVGYAVFRRRDA